MGSYYSIDALLTSSLKVPCTFDLDVPGLGFLDGNSGADIKRGQTPAVNIDLPPGLSQRVMNALKADPNTVDLRNQASHFYGLAENCLELFEEDEMMSILIDTFKKRAAAINDHAHNTQGTGGDGVEFLRGLEESERQLFRAAHDSSKAARAWMGEVKKKP